MERERDVYDVILETVWDLATASVTAADPQEARRAGLEEGYWMLFAAVPKPPPLLLPDDFPLDND